jgi:hypothetical protein
VHRARCAQSRRHKAVEQEVLFKLRERQDAQPVELGMVEIAQASSGWVAEFKGTRAVWSNASTRWREKDRA